METVPEEVYKPETPIDATAATTGKLNWHVKGVLGAGGYQQVATS
jgi:hypothetical protein